MSAADSAVDYQRLRTAFVSSAADLSTLDLTMRFKSATLSSLRALRTTKDQFKFEANQRFIASGYSDVYAAIHKGERVAVKKLRPTGHLQQRLRVAAVGTPLHI